MAEPGEDLVIGRSVTIRASEMTWRFSGSGGPGGQHANTSNTRVELVVSLEGLSAVSAHARSKLSDAFGTEIVVVASEHRSQYQNRRSALERLEAMIVVAMRPTRSRVATRPTKGSQRRRLEAKQRQSTRKAERRKPGAND